MDITNEMKSQKIRKWKKHVETLLLRSNVCGICLTEEKDLNHWETVYQFGNEKKERSLKEIFEIAFGGHARKKYEVSKKAEVKVKFKVISEILFVKRLLPTKYFCDNCTSTILRSYKVVIKIKTTYTELQKYFDVISHQVALSSEIEQPVGKQLMLTIDNINSLNVPTRVIEKDNSFTQIFVCDIENDPNDLKLEFENTEQKYECPYCEKQFHEYLLFKSHLIQHNEMYYRCSKCKKRFKYFKELIEHRTNTHLDLLTTCEVCQIILLSSESTEHEKYHHIACNICQTKFETKSQLQNHNATNHVDVKCKKCFKMFSNELKLEHHRCPYKCFECLDDCIHDQYLVSFREQHINKQRIFQCPDCDFKYFMKSQIICHANEVHLLHSPYLCDLCGENFSSKPNLTAHSNKKHSKVNLFEDDFSKGDGKIGASVLSDRPYECDLCEYCFSTEEAYSNHKSKRFTEKTQCQFCEKSFCNIGQLDNHMKKQHPDEVKMTIYSCSMCPLDFESRCDYFDHMATHPKGTLHTCRYCNVTFKSKNNYLSHTRKHKINYDRECPICFKMYTRNTISRHMRLHMGEEIEENVDATKLTNYTICHLCGVRLPNEKALINHSKNHSEQRECPHCQKLVNSVLYSKHISTHLQLQSAKTVKKCPECDYTTKFAVCLEAHINRHHLKVRPYKCGVCMKRFYSDYTLKGHKATHKDERPEHYCHICGKKFISKKALTLHTRIHTGETPYPCDLCELSFLSASRRRQHTIRKHFEPSVECQICQKKLYTQPDLKRHVADCHDGDSKRKKSKNNEVVIIEEQVVEESLE